MSQESALPEDTPEERLISLAERFVDAVESIAASLEGINAASQRTVNRLFPEPKKRSEVTEAKVTRVPTEEDLIEEELGQNDSRPASQWVGFGTDEEPFGQREHEFIERSAASPKAQGSAATFQRSVETPSDQS